MNDEDTKTYKITRFTFAGENDVIRRGLTLEEAKARCAARISHE